MFFLENIVKIIKFKRKALVRALGLVFYSEQQTLNSIAFSNRCYLHLPYKKKTVKYILSAELGGTGTAD